MASLLASLAQGATQDGARLWRSAELRRGVGDSAIAVLAVMDAVPDDAALWPVALGSQHGVTLWRSTPDSGAVEAGRMGETRRLSQLSAVQDLHFARDGSLWIATARGLWRLSAAGRLEDRSPGAGEAARWVHRVAALSGVVVATTQAGAFATGDGRRWRRLSPDLPLGSADALALRTLRSGRLTSTEAVVPTLEVWLSVRGVVRRLSLQPAKQLEAGGKNEPPALDVLDVLGGADGTGSTGGWVVSKSERLPPVSGLGAGAVPLQILLDWPEMDVVVLYADAIAVRAEAGGGWEVVRPVLPAEARAVWLTRAAGHYWLATDRGLMRAAHWRGPWRRAASPVGSVAVYRVAAAGDLLLAATGQGLFAGRLAPELPGIRRDTERDGSLSSDPAPRGLVSHAALREFARGSKGAGDPSVLAVQQAALRYLGLRAERTADLRRGVDRRGWLPALSVRLAGAFDRENRHDYDEAFLSGATRTLRDRDWQSGRDFDVSISLVWDLRDLAYNPEAVDLSREVRQLISLRDDVLDQINQAYFERQALLRVLEAEPAEGGPSEAERYRLRLRVDELAAGLDGWTGGWFGSQRGAQAIQTEGAD